MLTALLQSVGTVADHREDPTQVALWRMLRNLPAVLMVAIAQAVGCRYLISFFLIAPRITKKFICSLSEVLSPRVLSAGWNSPCQATGDLRKCGCVAHQQLGAPSGTFNVSLLALIT